MKRAVGVFVGDALRRVGTLRQYGQRQVLAGLDNLPALGREYSLENIGHQL